MVGGRRVMARDRGNKRGKRGKREKEKKEGWWVGEGKR